MKSRRGMVGEPMGLFLERAMMIITSKDSQKTKMPGKRHAYVKHFVHQIEGFEGFHDGNSRGKFQKCSFLPLLWQVRFRLEFNNLLEKNKTTKQLQKRPALRISWDPPIKRGERPCITGFFWIFKPPVT